MFVIGLIVDIPIKYCELAYCVTQNFFIIFSKKKKKKIDKDIYYLKNSCKKFCSVLRKRAKKH